MVASGSRSRVAIGMIDLEFYRGGNSQIQDWQLKSLLMFMSGRLWADLG